MADSSFFDKPTPQSRVKAKIVASYFDAWSRVLLGTVTRFDQTIQYIDLYSGTGMYADGTPSTPLLVLGKAIDNPGLCKRLRLIFGDKNQKRAEQLQQEITGVAGIENLARQPDVHCHDVGADIVKLLQDNRLVPTLAFLDPWGYQGLTLELVNAVIKDWGCECIFFFNYNRINAGLNNTTVEQRMDGLFGKERADRLRAEIADLPPAEREQRIIQAIEQALREQYGQYVVTFRFLSDNGKRTSHYLIFVTKNFKGYEIMKEIMAKESTEFSQGVPSFEFNPVHLRQPELVTAWSPLDDLEQDLLVRYAGRTLSRDAIYREHSIGTKNLETNYKQALLNLEDKGLVTTEPAREKRRRNQLAGNVKISFPKR